MVDITFECPECRNPLSVDAKGAGMKVRCPQCTKSIVIPCAPALPPLPPVDALNNSTKPMQKEGYMYCRNCGKDVHEKAIACPACGVPPRIEKKFCNNCGAQTQSNQAMCTKCGISLAGGSGKKSKIAAGVLAIMLGAYGGHQFYLGNRGSAVIRLLVSLVGIFLIGIPTLVMAVIAIIEGIKYLTMSDDAFDDIYVTKKQAWF